MTPLDTPEQVRALMKDKESYRQFAGRLGVSYGFICDVLNGKREISPQMKAFMRENLRKKIS